MALVRGLRSNLFAAGNATKCRFQSPRVDFDAHHQRASSHLPRFVLRGAPHVEDESSHKW